MTTFAFHSSFADGGGLRLLVNGEHSYFAAGAVLSVSDFFSRFRASPETPREHWKGLFPVLLHHGGGMWY